MLEPQIKGRFYSPGGLMVSAIKRRGRGSPDEQPYSDSEERSPAQREQGHC